MVAFGKGGGAEREGGYFSFFLFGLFVAHGRITSYKRE